jgi:hypothetical protein
LHHISAFNALSGAAINVLWDLCRGHYRILLLFPEWRKRQCQQTGTQNYTRKNNPSGSRQKYNNNRQQIFCRTLFFSFLPLNLSGILPDFRFRQVVF